MAPAANGLAVAIVGMHRSGTSMVARILAECGLYLGEADDLLPAGEGNPEGHFEHKEFLRLNDELLAVLGGAWDVPPPRYALWRRRRLGPLRREAAKLVDELRPRAPWGWKDPRTSLTLPFWRGVVPELRIVICARDVVAVAHSLLVRDHSSELFGMRLWTAYNRRLLSDAPRERSVVTEYERYFDDPEREVERLVRAIGLPAGPEAVTRAAATVSRAQLHHRIDYDPAGLPRAVGRCRRRLLRLAAT